MIERSAAGAPDGADDAQPARPESARRLATNAIDNVSLGHASQYASGAGLRNRTGPGQDAGIRTCFPQKETTMMTFRSTTPPVPMLLVWAFHPTIVVAR